VRNRQRTLEGIPCGKSYISRRKQCRVGKGATLARPGDRGLFSLWKREPEAYPQYDYPGKKTEQKTLAVVEDKIRDLPYERAIAVDAKGNVLFDQKGEQTSVAFTSEQVRQMKGAVLTHNHPNLGFKEGSKSAKGLSFSLADLNCACVTEAREIRAAASGYDHSLKPPKRGWNLDYYNNVVAPAWQYREQQLVAKYQMNILMGKVSQDNVHADFQHELMIKVAKDTGMIYKRTAVRRRS